MAQGKKGSPVEFPVTLFLNGTELMTIQMTPVDIEEWTVGYLFGEGIIQKPNDLDRLTIDAEHGMIWVHVAGAEHFLEDKGRKRFLTSGCGKGVTFSSVQDAYRIGAVHRSFTVTQDFLLECTRFMYKEAYLYQETGGMHAAIVATLDGPLFIKEDIGRHNAVDKVIGAALQIGLDPADVLIMTTGRISYEMVSKVARFGGSMIASRTAATDQAVKLASQLGIEVIGYIRGQMLQVYTDGFRVIIPTHQHMVDSKEEEMRYGHISS